VGPLLSLSLPISALLKRVHMLFGSS
jgi:hypothetical protein